MLESPLCATCDHSLNLHHPCTATVTTKKGERLCGCVNFKPDPAVLRMRVRGV